MSLPMQLRRDIILDRVLGSASVGNVAGYICILYSLIAFCPIKGLRLIINIHVSSVI